MASLFSVMLALHLVGAVAWVGAALFQVTVIGPALRRAGPQAAGFLKAVMQGGGFSPYFAVAGTLTILAGGYLIGQFKPWEDLTTGNTLLIVGALLGLGAWLEGFLAQRPAEARLKRILLGLQGPPSPEQAAELQGLGERIGKLGVTSTAMIVAAFILMLLSRML